MKRTVSSFLGDADSASKKPKTTHKKTYISFDIGIVHLGYSIIEVYDEEVQDLQKFPFRFQVVETECVDVTQIPCETDCALHHTKQIYDRMAHFWAWYEPRWLKQFGEFSNVFLERQPIHGIGSVEALLFQRYRNKVIQVSPNAMHKYFGIHHFTYDQRKEFVVNYTTPYLKSLANFQQAERKHDMSDALILFLFQMTRILTVKQKEKTLREKKLLTEQWFQETRGQNLDEYFNQFKCKIAS